MTLRPWTKTIFSTPCALRVRRPLELARENGEVLVNGDGQHAARLLRRVSDVPASLSVTR